MIFDIGWIELLVIAVMAIIIVGPKDLPKMMRVLGQWLGKARGLAREFQKSIDDLVRESELEDLKKEVEELKKLNPIEDVKKALDPTDELRDLDKSMKEDLEGVSEDIKDKKPEGETAKASDVDLASAQEDKERERENQRKENVAASGEGAAEP